MIDFSLSEEERAVRDTIRQFIQQEVMPLEDQVLRNERSGLPPLEPGQLAELQRKARAGGWWGINTPEQYGGIALGPVMSAIVAMETGRNADAGFALESLARRRVAAEDVDDDLPERPPREEVEEPFDHQGAPAPSARSRSMA